MRIIAINNYISGYRAVEEFQRIAYTKEFGSIKHEKI